jgi:putative Holliday junction resolvase
VALPKQTAVVSNTLMRLLSVDYGTKRTGIALGDTESRLALPFEIFENLADGPLAQAIADLVRREAADALVVGLPLNQDGSMSRQCKLTERFIVTLQQTIGPQFPIHRVNEFLSSHHAEGKLAGHYTRLQKRARVDALAAAGILQDWLDQQPRNT